MRSRPQRQFLRLSQLVVFCLLIPLSGNVLASNGDDELNRINAIKAAFVLNIARYVTWPSEVFSSDKDPMRLCVYRDNDYKQVMEVIKGKKIGQRRLEFFTIDHVKPDLACEILIIPYSLLGIFHKEFDGKLQQPLLTIVDQTEIDDGERSRKGIIVTLIREDSRIAFEIDPKQAKRANLHMSSELLKLAKIVGEGSK